MAVTTHNDRHHTLATAISQLGHAPREALDFAQAICDEAMERGAKREAAAALAVIGQCLAALGRLIDARTTLERAETQLLDAGDVLAASCCRRELAVVVYFQGEYPLAQHLFESALSELEAANAGAETCLCLCWMSMMASFRHLNADARRYYESARGCLEEGRQTTANAMFHLAVGIYLRRLSLYDEAFAALQEAATQFEGTGHAILLGYTLMQQGFLWLTRQELAKTATAAERALAILEQCGAHHYAAMTRELQGRLATDTNEFALAYDAIAAAQAVYEEQDMKVLAAQAALHRANVDFWLDAWGDAERGYLAMVDVARRYGSYHHLLLAESNLGLVALNRGRHDEALLHTHAALDLAIELQRPDDAARCHRHLGNIYGTLQRWEQAHQHFEAAIACYRQLNQPLYLANTQAEYAEYERARGDYASARRLISVARPILIEYDSRLFVAECDYRLARLALDEGDIATAEKRARDSYGFQAEQESLNEIARLHVVFGGIALARGDEEEARRQYERAFALLSRPFPDEAVQAATALGRLSADDPHAALAWYRRAVEVAQQARSLVPTEPLAAELARQSAPALRAALALTSRLGQHELALSLVEDARAQVALAWLEGQRRSQTNDEAGRQLAERCFALRTLLEEAEAAIQPDEREREHTAVLRAEYDDALALWRRFGSNVIPGTVQPFRWNDCRAQLDQLGVPWHALVYWLDDDPLTVWHCNRDGVRSYERRLTDEESHSLRLCSDCSGHRRAFLYDRDPATMWTNSASTVHLRRAAEVLIPADLASMLTPDTLLVIVPAGMLHALPFAVLPIDAEPLIQRATLCVAPSLQLLGRLVERPAATGRAVLTMGVPEHQHREALPHACDEARMVAARTGGVSWCAGAASTTRLRQASTNGELARYRAIHIATHAWVGVTRGEQAGLALSDGDMLVTDLAQLHLDADVVVLSACESGNSLHHPGEEMIGLIYALLQAGSRAIVASLWKVDDAVSLELMDALYQALNEGHRGPWALARMQRAALVLGHPAFHWAGYQWHGRPITNR